MKYMFDIKPTDAGLTLTLKKEANIKLASIKDEYEKFNYYTLCENVLAVTTAIDNTDPQDDDDVNNILSMLNTIWHKGILSPLTLKDDEFELEYEGVYRNKRYYHIVKIENDIFNTHAYKVSVRKSYDNTSKSETKKIPIYSFPADRLYIYKGGRVTGEYIYDCKIRQEFIDKHLFTIQSIVNIPVSTIELKGKTICIVDFREPKLKVLKQFYDCPIKIDTDIKDLNIDIRKYKKF